MLEMDGSSKPPQISEMFQKFALAFKTKTFEFFTDDDTAAVEDSDCFSLLDSAEEVITDQKVIILKPDNALLQHPPPEFDQTHNFFPITQQSVPESATTASSTNTQVIKSDQTNNFSQQLATAKKSSETQIRISNPQIPPTLISSLFATISSFETSYLNLQTAHVPFVEESVKAADKALVSHLQRLSGLKQRYKDFYRNSEIEVDLPIGSCLEAQVQENQSKLRILETVVNRLQSEIDDKDDEVFRLRRKLGEIQSSNLKLSKRFSMNLTSNFEVLLSVKVFDSVLNDARRAMHKFTKILIDLMRKATWDLDLAANSVHSDIVFVKKAHNRYSFLSYVCLGMFRGFSLEKFCLGELEIVCNGHVSNSGNNSSLKQLLEHASSNPMEVLRMNQNCEFSKFCERKYQELIHPTMELSIFSNLDRNEVVLSSWRSVSGFYESFVKMASSIWSLHKLAFSFDPVVEIFQVERGVEFSMVYMEDVTRKYVLPSKTRPNVGFTVMPGFKIGKTIIQCQVYLSGLKCTE